MHSDKENKECSQQEKEIAAEFATPQKRDLSIEAIVQSKNFKSQF